MDTWHKHLLLGQVIPACPLALQADGRWSPQHQRALLRYYMAAGAGGIAVGVHSTQFAIRRAEHGLYQPVLELTAETLRQTPASDQSFVRIAGVCGPLAQATREAQLAAHLNYHAILVSLGGLDQLDETDLIAHCAELAEILPVIGFYLQPAVGGRWLSYRFWRSLFENSRVVAVKIAPFNRYSTGDVVRAAIDSRRLDLALYTGNDDNIIADLLTPFTYRGQTRYIVGGLLGQWAVWTQRAVELLKAIRAVRGADQMASDWLRLNAALTDANAAIFDAANGFAGCIPGINEVLRRAGLVPSNRCLDPHETLSVGQIAEIERVVEAYPELNDDAFVSQHREQWLQS